MRKLSLPLAFGLALISGATLQAATLTPATGGGAISADATGGSYTSLTGPVYQEGNLGDVGAGSIVLNAPSGFVFDTGGTLPTVLLNGGSNSARNINNLTNGATIAVTVTSTNLTISIASSSMSGSGSALNKLTWQNVRVRPSAGTPLASANITKSGTATMVGVTNGTTNFGTLTEVAGAATKMFVTLPNQTFTSGSGNSGSVVTQTVGTAFNISKLSAVDQFTNIVTSYAGAKTISYSGPGGSPTYTTAVSFSAGQSTTTLATTLRVAETTTITAIDGTLTGVPSSSLTVIKGNQTITFGALANKTYGDAPFNVSATASSGLTVSFSILSGPATISGNTITLTGNGTVTVRASQTGDANWNTAANVDQSFTVAKATVTGSITADNKIYDGTTTATIATRTLTGVIGSDSVVLTGGTATFANKNVGTGKTVTATALSLTGADAGKYQLASTTATTAANITARSLTISAAAANKTYDGTTTASITLSDNRVVGDTLSVSSTTATFADKNVGTGKTVSVTGITVTGADAGNYQLASTSASTTADITARSLTVSATGANKVYDGTTDATVTLSDNRVAGDTLTTAYTTATFADKNVGTGKSVSVTGISVTGTDAGNYTFNSSASTTANITAKALTVSGITADNKVYDGTTSATLNTASAVLSGMISGDTVTLNSAGASGVFADKNVGTGITVTVNGWTLSGADAGNYTLSQPTGLTANITARTLTVSATGVNKPYDGTTDATVTLSDDRVAGDILTNGYTTAEFVDKELGTDKPVSVSGITVTGPDAGNYTFNTTASTTANIAVKVLTVSGVTANNKVYDGDTTATLNVGSAALVGVASGDTVTLDMGSASGVFGSKTAGTGKTVTISGLTISGTDAGNYTLTQPTTTANITPATVTGSITADNKVYDGNASATIATRTLSGVIGADVVSLTGGAATFANKNVATGKSVTATGLSLAGADAGNYQLASTSVSTTADITARSLTVSATGVNKLYDGTNAATVTLSDNRVAGDVLTNSYTTAEFADKNVGTGKTVSVTGITVTGADAGNYTFNATASTTANITAKGLTVSSVTASNKVYDGTTAATINTGSATLVGVVSGDTVTLDSGSAAGAFADKNIGNSKVVTVSGLALNGAGAGNYTLTQPTTTANITAKTLTVSGITGNNKLYDGNTTATLSTNSAALVGVVGGDVVNLSTAGATGTFADKTVGTGKTVSVSGLTISGAGAGNYTLTQPSATADITAKALTVSGITASNKVYDATTSATLNTNSAALVGKVGSDVVNLSTAGATGTFTNKNVGTGKVVNVAGLTISGTDAGNYSLTQPSTTANITAKALTVSATGINKVYDGTTTATVTLSDNRVAGDILTTAYTTATFTNKNVGTGKAVSVSGITLTGADSSNYTFNTAASTTANITLATVTGSFTADNKVYDGTTSATIATRSLSGGVSGENVMLSGGTATFDNKSIGTGKTVTGTGFSLGGSAKNNYQLASTTLTTTANITARPLTVSATVVNRVYDGTSSATVTLSDNRVAGDVLTTAYTTASFANKNVGTGKTVSVTGITVTGTDVGNYTFNTTATTTADITAKALTVSGITASNKVYDGTTSALLNTGSAALSGVISGDTVTLNTAGASGAFADKNVGTGITVTVNGWTLSGADAGNYTLSQPTGLTANITARTLTVSATGVNKPYDGTTDATVTLSDDRVTGDILTNDYATAEFVDKELGTDKPVSVSGITVTGPDAGNYTFNTTASTTANITAATLTVSGVTANNKVYDGDTNATLNVDSAALVGVISGETVTLNTGSVTGAFANKNVGTGKTVTVTGLTISGTDSGNYTLTQPTTTANITSKDLTVSGLAVNNKVYDGGTNATLNTASAALVGVVNGDTVTLNTGSASGAFANKNVGTGTTVTVTGLTISGTDSGNYTLPQPTTTGNITAATVTGSITADNKVYDGTTVATIASRTLTGVIGDDVVSLTGGAATFADKNAGTGKTVTATGLGLSGADAGNYQLASTSASSTADITARELIVSATGVNKVYDGTTAATVTLSDNRVADDVLTTGYTTAEFADENIGDGKAVGVTGITVTGTDAGNYTFNTTASTTANITAPTQTAPSITCPADIVLSNAPGECSSNIAFAATASGEPTPTVLYTIDSTVVTSPYSFPVGTTIVDSTASNDAGIATCSFTVTVIDTEPPTISSCATDVTVSCAADLPVPDISSVTATDTCGTVTVSFVDDTITNQTCANRYTVLRTYQAIDAASNTATCTQTITVDDQTAPVITSTPAYTTVFCAAAVPAADDSAVTATDNCGGTVTITHDADAISAQTCANRYTISRTYHATDACGNSTSVTQTITVNDTTAPVLSGVPASATVSCDAVPSAATVTATDNCDGNAVVNFSETRTDGNCQNNYTLTRTWTATDACGNSASQSQTLTVRDTTAPVLSGQGADETIESPATPVFTAPTATDNCDAAPVLSFSDVTNQLCGTTYSVTRTWTATDACGNISVPVSQTITVGDTTAPLISCPAEVTTNIEAGACSASGVVLGSPTTSDNGGGVITVINDAPSTFPTGTNLVVWTATDGCGNNATCTQQVIVVDNEPPTIGSCPTNLTVSCASDVPAPDVSSVSATDNCTAVMVSFVSDTITNQTCPNRYTVIRGYQATDAAGNSATCSQTITVDDQTVPTITASPADTTVSCASAVPAADDSAVTATDNCGGPVTITHDADAISAQTCANRYTISRTYHATDACGNSASVTQTITVDDETPPVISASPADTTMQCAAAVPAADDTVVTATDNCAGPVTVTHDADVISGQTCANRYTISRTYHATDACGNSSSVTQTITIDDQTAPTLSGQGDDETIESPATPVFTSPSASDNCDASPLISFSDATNQLCGASYRVTRTWTATDSCGNVSAPVNQTITVGDTTTPLISCPAEVTTNTDAGACSASGVVLGSPTTSDNSGGTITVVNDAPSTFSTGTNRVVWTATDGCGNASSCTQNVIVVDTEPPTVSSCPAALTVSCASDVPAPDVSSVSATDNCTAVTVSFVSDTITNQTCASRYTLLRTYQATDAAGNSATCTQTITVDDETPPVITANPADTTLSCVSAVPAADDSAVTATDNCGGPVTITHDADAISAQTCANRYTISRTYHATDACGNASSVTQTITVNDTTAPAITSSPASVTVQCATEVPAADDSAVTATDNCGGAFTITHSDVVTAGSCANNYTITRTWTATDACGNASSVTQIITVNDTTAPVLSGQGADETIESPAMPVFTAPTVTDNCDAAPVPSFSDVTNQLCGTTYSVTRTWTATDACGNISVPVSQTITVGDTTPPLISCPAEVTTNTDAGACSASGVVLGSPTTSDNGGGVITVLNDAPSTFPTGTNLVVWTATDGCGNNATCTQQVIVVDNEPPTIGSCPTNLTVSCASEVSAPDVSSVSATDNCTAVTVSFVSDTITNQTCASRYTLLRTYQATDASGNSATCSQTITVDDETAPTITASPADTTVSCAAAVPAADDAAVTATDNCGGPITVTHDADAISNQTCPNRYTISRTYHATDACGNASSVTQTITVNDTTGPVLSGVPADAPATCDAVPAPATVSASDDCDGSVSVSFSQTTTQTASGCGKFNYTITRTWTAIDSCGNATSVTQTLTIADSSAPVIHCPADQQLACGASTALEQTGTATATDACDPNPTISYSDTPTAANCTGQAGIDRTWTATDACGNSASCVQHISFVDTTPPVISCPSNVTVSNDTGECYASGVILGTPTASDNCEGSGMVVNDALAQFPIGTNQVVWTVTDECGNSDTCTQLVIVVDSRPVPWFRIVSIKIEGGDVRATWTADGGSTNVLQAASSLSGNLSNSFADISAPIVTVGCGEVTTNYVDVGAASSARSRFYRVRLVP